MSTLTIRVNPDFSFWVSALRHE